VAIAVRINALTAHGITENPNRQRILRNN